MAPTVIKSSNQPVILEKKQANEFAFKSCLKGPINELSVLRRSLFFAEVSMAAYFSTDQCNIAAGKLGFTDGKLFEFGGAKAYWFQNQFDSVVVFRGIEVHHWDDITAYADMPMTLAETVGQVHQGFKTEVDEIWPRLEPELAKNTKTLWLTGHALGGAMATICAGRCMLSYVKTEPEELYTFGSPRVGCNRYVDHVKLSHFRWVNNDDALTRFPPARQGYRHSGTEMYIDQFGRFRDRQGWRRIGGWLQGALSGLRRNRMGQLSDHASPLYTDAIFKIVRAEENKPNSRYAEPGKIADAQNVMGPVNRSENPIAIETQQQLRPKLVANDSIGSRTNRVNS